MNRKPLVLVSILALAATLLAAQQSDDPVESGTTERVDVNLVLIETLVLDGAGRTVPDLGKDDFLLTVDGKAVEIDTLDVTCPAGSLPEPKSVEPGERREPPPAPPEGRKIVLAFDYFHNDGPIRQEILDRAARLVEGDLAPGDEVMIVALAGGLRVEQRFTDDPDALLAALDRMEHDVTLWARDFTTLTDRAYFETIATLLAVLGEHDGAKAVVLFSAYRGPSAANDLWYQSVAERSAASRAVLYPMDTVGLDVGTSVGPALARLANETGGRLTRNTNDFSLAYARAQRDLSCRYAVGFYIDASEVGKSRQVRVRAKRSGLEVRAPEAYRMGSEQERIATRVLAAFVEPGLFDDPLVRAHVFPMRPASKKKWNAIVTLDFRPHIGEEGIVRDVGLTVVQDTLKIDEFSRRIMIRPGRPSGTGSRLVTLVGDGEIKPGSYEMTVVLADPNGDQVQTTTLDFTIPEVPKKTLNVQGPILARVDPAGVLFVFEGGEDAPARTGGGRDDDDLLSGGTVEPMLVTVLDSDDAVFVVSDLCAVGVSDPDDGTTVTHRVVRESDGEVVHALDAAPVALEGEKKLRCQRVRHKMEGGVLAAGEYRMEVVLSGSDEARAATRFAVR